MKRYTFILVFLIFLVSVSAVRYMPTTVLLRNGGDIINASLVEVNGTVNAWEYKINGTDTGDIYLKLDASNDPVTGNLELNNNLKVGGYVGINTNPVAGVNLKIQEDDVIGVSVANTIKTDYTTGVAGTFAISSSGSTDPIIVSLTGVRGYATHSSTATPYLTTPIIGGDFLAKTSFSIGAGVVIPELTGVNSYTDMRGDDSTITNAYMFKGNYYKAISQDITNMYGLYIPSLGGTNSYAIKTGDGVASFGDDIQADGDNIKICTGASQDVCQYYTGSTEKYTAEVGNPNLNFSNFNEIQLSGDTGIYGNAKIYDILYFRDSGDGEIYHDVSDFKIRNTVSNEVVEIWVNDGGNMRKRFYCEQTYCTAVRDFNVLGDMSILTLRVNILQTNTGSNIRFNSPLYLTNGITTQGPIDFDIATEYMGRGGIEFNNKYALSHDGSGDLEINYGLMDKDVYMYGNYTITQNLKVQGDLNISANVNINGNLTAKIPYWTGYDNSTQQFKNTAAVQVINISNNIDHDNYLIDVINMQNLTFKQPGDYQCTLSPEFFQNGGGSKINFWYQKNGVDVPWSNSRYSMQNNEYHAPSIIYHFDIEHPSTDNIRFMWWSDSTNTQIYSSGLLTAPNRPRIPGILLSCLRVSSISP